MQYRLDLGKINLLLIKRDLNSKKQRQKLKHFSPSFLFFSPGLTSLPTLLFSLFFNYFLFFLMPRTTLLPFLHMYFALSNVCFPEGHLICWAQPYSMMGLLGLVGFSCVMGLPQPLLTEAPAATLLLMLIQSWQYTFNLFLSFINSSDNYQYMNGFMRYQSICPNKFIYLFISDPVMAL